MAIDLVTRQEWNAREPRGNYERVSSTKGAKVHYTGDLVSPDIVNDHAKCVVLVRSIQKQHMDGNGWIDVGYSLLVCPHRKVFEGRGLHHLPAANGAGLNSGHYAVLGLVGSKGLVVPPDDMLHGIVDAIEYLRAEGGAGKEIKGHQDGFATDCPGEHLYAWVRRGAPRPGGTTPKPSTKPGVKAPAWPGRLLEYPPVMQGEDVRTWQAQMDKRGWDIDVDGLYGDQSADVAEAFQLEKGLVDDRMVGRLTWAAAWESPIT